MIDVLLNPASYAESLIVIAYVLAVVGLGLSLFTGFDGTVATFPISIGLMFAAFLLLFLCAILVTSTGHRRTDDRRR